MPGDSKIIKNQIEIKINYIDTIFNSHNYGAYNNILHNFKSTRNPKTVEIAF